MPQAERLERELAEARGAASSKKAAAPCGAGSGGGLAPGAAANVLSSLGAFRSGIADVETLRRLPLQASTAGPGRRLAGARRGAAGGGGGVVSLRVGLLLAYFGFLHLALLCSMHNHSGCHHDEVAGVLPGH